MLLFLLQVDTVNPAVLCSVSRKLARSTLVLIPLFGFHYVVFIGLSAFMNVNRVLELIWLFGDQLFASFQVRADEVRLKVMILNTACLQ